jgi:hypothetical protein
MKLPPDMIHAKIEAFFAEAGEHGRYLSWDHCYGYFQRNSPEIIAADRDHAALHLGFYLASWGMYRPRGFLREGFGKDGIWVLELTHAAELAQADDEIKVDPMVALWHQNWPETIAELRAEGVIPPVANVPSFGTQCVNPLLDKACVKGCQWHPLIRSPRSRLNGGNTRLTIGCHWHSMLNPLGESKKGQRMPSRPLLW